MEEIDIGQTTLELVKGDIASQNDLTAVVNAANAQLMPGGGVAGALHGAAGPGLAEECRKYAPISPGEAVITGGHKLPNSYVIHCLGPVYGRDKPEEKLLRDCYRKALDLAVEKEIDSLGFPAISMGAFGYPREEASWIALSTVRDYLVRGVELDLVRFVLYNQKDLDLFARQLTRLKEGEKKNG